MRVVVLVLVAARGLTVGVTVIEKDAILVPVVLGVAVVVVEEVRKGTKVSVSVKLAGPPTTVWLLV